MTNRNQLQGERNPFATKHIRAGYIGYRFHGATSLESLRTRLRERNWWGQIVGPHGSGKTTLLHTLQPHWGHWHRDPKTFVLRNGQRRIRDLDWHDWSHETQVIVDGFEQLCLLSKLMLMIRCRWKGSGLLVTTHAASRLLSVVQENRTTLELARAIVHDLTTDDRRPTNAEIAGCYKRSDGNLRETLMCLYDAHQHSGC